jgi:hypothetical protein
MGAPYVFITDGNPTPATVDLTNELAPADIVTGVTLGLPIDPVTATPLVLAALGSLSPVVR